MKNMIKFKEMELKKYPMLKEIFEGQEVVAYGGDYEGLKGTIDHINYLEKDRESENECIVEIIVDFEEPSESDRVNKYAHLNGTSVQQVIMIEDDELAFDFNENCYKTLQGQLVCYSCLRKLDSITEMQYDYIRWDWEDGQYKKYADGGDSNYLRCPHCYSII